MGTSWWISQSVPITIERSNLQLALLLDLPVGMNVSGRCLDSCVSRWRRWARIWLSVGDWGCGGRLTGRCLCSREESDEV